MVAVTFRRIVGAVSFVSTTFNGKSEQQHEKKRLQLETDMVEGEEAYLEEALSIPMLGHVIQALARHVPFQEHQEQTINDEYDGEYWPSNASK